MEILEVIIMSDNLKRTEDFYREKLGLIILKKGKNHISFKAGRSVLTFLKSKNLHPIYHFAFNIPCNQIHEAVTWASLKLDLLNTEDNQVIADFTNWNAQSFYFLDNNGNILEFIARRDLNNESHTSFYSSSIISISEFGLVTDNVADTAQKLRNNYGIPLFSKQPVLKNFAAVGDDNGLLILSTPGRKWHPTDIAVQGFYSKIKLHEGEKTLEIETDVMPRYSGLL
jgi:catechol 2,3-dioxygenase-like lactoylglutathione lyase family enzyme